jgi:two-component system OmpR family response regulator
VALTAKEFQALAFLYSKGGHLVSKEALAAHVWPEYEGAVGDYNIDQLIFRLRKKLGVEEGEPGYLKTLPRLGYRLAV